MLEDYKDILTVSQLKEILNYKSNTTVYKLLNEGIIKARRVQGGRWLIPKENVINFLMGKTYVCLYNEDSAEELQRIDV